MKVMFKLDPTLDVVFEKLRLKIFIAFIIEREFKYDQVFKER